MDLAPSNVVNEMKNVLKNSFLSRQNPLAFLRDQMEVDWEAILTHQMQIL